MTQEQAEAKEPEAKGDVSRIVQGLASALALLVGGLYSVGLLIVNVDLSRYGLVSLDLARPEYAMAGALWCFLTAVVYGGAKYEARFVRRYHSEKKYVRMIVLGIGLGGLSYLLALLWVLVMISPGSVDFELEAIPPLVALMWNGLTVGMMVEDAKAVVKARQGVASALFELRSKHRPAGVYLVLWALGGISVYAAYVYPVVPREFGGGLRPLVRLFLTTKADKWISDLGISAPGADGSIGPVALLMESDSYFVVARANTRSDKHRWFPPVFAGVRTTGPAVGIDKKMISAVVYVPRSTASPQTNAEPPARAEPPTKAEPAHPRRREPTLSLWLRQLAPALSREWWGAGNHWEGEVAMEK